MMKSELKCFDGRQNVWYPAHEWVRGKCARCGLKQPGVSDEARDEMDATAARVRRGGQTDADRALML